MGKIKFTTRIFKLKTFLRGGGWWIILEKKGSRWYLKGRNFCGNLFWRILGIWQKSAYKFPSISIFFCYPPNQIPAKSSSFKVSFFSPRIKRGLPQKKKFKREHIFTLWEIWLKINSREISAQISYFIAWKFRGTKISRFRGGGRKTSKLRCRKKRFWSSTAKLKCCKKRIFWSTMKKSSFF